MSNTSLNSWNTHSSNSENWTWKALLLSAIISTSALASCAKIPKPIDNEAMEEKCVFIKDNFSELKANSCIEKVNQSKDKIRQLLERRMHARIKWDAEEIKEMDREIDEEFENIKKIEQTHKSKHQPTLDKIRDYSNEVQAIILTHWFGENSPCDSAVGPWNRRIKWPYHPWLDRFEEDTKDSFASSQSFKKRTLRDRHIQELALQNNRKIEITYRDAQGNKEKIIIKPEEK